MMATLTTKAVIPKIEELSGNLTAVARSFKCSRQTLYRFMENHPTVRDALQEARETMLDNAESSLYRAVLGGEAWAVCFFLKTQGKGRNYVERQEHSGADGGPIPVSIIEVRGLPSGDE